MLRKSIHFLSTSDTARKLLMGIPFTRSMSRKFVPGETVESLIQAIREANAEGLKVTANYLGEAVKDRASATAAADTYHRILEAIGKEGLDANVSLKFTQMGQDIDEAFLRDNLGRLLKRADQDKIFIRFDMESSPYVQRTLDAFDQVWDEGWREIGVVLQAYLHRTEGDVRAMIAKGVRVRLCKGAYNEPASVAIKDSAEITKNYVRLAKMLVSEGNYPAFATHDDGMIDQITDYVRKEGIPADRFEFQMLYGVRTELQKQLLAEGWNVRVYIPFGEKWYPYLMRRLAERPANIILIGRSAFGGGGSSKRRKRS